MCLKNYIESNKNNSSLFNINGSLESNITFTLKSTI
jgi:hypothetical protein